MQKIIKVEYTTYAFVKRKPEKCRLAGIQTLTSVIPVQRSNWELATAGCHAIYFFFKNLKLVLASNEFQI